MVDRNGYYDPKYHRRYYFYMLWIYWLDVDNEVIEYID